MEDHRKIQYSTYNSKICNSLLETQNHSTVSNMGIISNTTNMDKLSKLNLEELVLNEPPDGGMRAWLIVFSAFLCNGILFGIINTFGIIYLTLQEKMTTAGDTDASSKAALVGSLTIGTTFLLSPVSGILTDNIGLRNTTLFGGFLAATGMFLSAIFVNNINVLYLTYGVMFGLGAALAYTPSLSILGHYFKRYLGLVNGFVASGSSVSTAILPFVLETLLRKCHIEWTFGAMGLLSLVIIVCALIYKPLRPPLPTPALKQGQTKYNVFLRSLVNVDNWKRPRYIIWAVSIPVALIGYFVPFVHINKLVKINFPQASANAPIMCIGITSGVGRILFGYLADIKGINRINLQQISFVVIGVLTMVIPFTTSYNLLLTICLAMGLVDGCFISLLGPIAYDICGPRGATQAIGFLLGMCSIGLTSGPPIAGMLYDQTNSYKLPFVLAGIPPLIGATMMCMMKFVHDNSETVKPTKPAWSMELNGNSPIKNIDVNNGKLLNKVEETYQMESIVTGIANASKTKQTHHLQSALLQKYDYAMLVADICLFYPCAVSSQLNKRRYDYSLL